MEQEDAPTKAPHPGRTILVTSGTGNVGKGVLDALYNTSIRVVAPVTVRATYHTDRSLRLLQDRYPPIQGAGAIVVPVPMDLDDPSTFSDALRGVDCVFLLTGYTIKMLVQSKTLVDAAVKSGVKHIVHGGVMGKKDTALPTFAWHEMVERYIESFPGLHWTHLHPSVYLQSLMGYVGLPKEPGVLTMYWKPDYPLVWADTDDVGEVAARVLMDPYGHHGQTYLLSSEIATLEEVRKIIEEEIGKEFRLKFIDPEEWAKHAMEETGESAYLHGIKEAFVQHNAGTFDEGWAVYPTLESLLKRKPTGVRQFVKKTVSHWRY